MTYWDGQIMTLGNGVFDNILDCFTARVELSEEVGGQNGHFPVNMQAICVKVEIKE